MGKASINPAWRTSVLRLTVCAISIALLSQLQAQTISAQTPTVTRLVKIYSDYELRLADAVKQRNISDIDRLIASDFEMRSTDDIGVPIPRSDWIAQSLIDTSSAASISKMAVHDYGDIRIVGFVINHVAAGARKAGATAVVDVWIQSGNNSVLKVRYSTVLLRSPRE